MTKNEFIEKEQIEFTNQMDPECEAQKELESNSLVEIAQSMMPKTFAKKFKQLKKAQDELATIENEIKEKLKVIFESIPELEQNSVTVDGIKFTYVGPSKRKSVDTKKLQEEHPEIYKKMLKESNVKSSIRISIEY